MYYTKHPSIGNISQEQNDKGGYAEPIRGMVRLG